jgi:hypothetical protein
MKQSQSQDADTGESGKSDETMPHPTGRKGTSTADRHMTAAEELETAPTTQPAEAHFDVGSGEEETPDGLDAEAEAVRQAAEEGSLEAPEGEDVPVFDQANRSERI